MDPSTVGDLLRAHRRRAGLTQGELASRAGLSIRTLREIEQDRVARPRLRSVELLAQALDLADADRAALLAAPAGGTAAGRGRRVRVEVLGPLAVRRGQTAVELPSAMQRSLLGLLAVQPHTVVPVEEIIDVLWGERPPASCQRLVHLYIAQLRDLLEPGRPRRGPAEGLRRVRGGYRLELTGDRLDVVDFDESTDRAGQQRGRAAPGGDARAALELYARALRCWRGPVLADGGDRLRLHPAVISLARRRVSAGLAYADLAFELHCYDEAAGLLRPLAADEPLDEAVAARLMLALAGCGQQVAALRIFDELRGRLADELGVEPGPELRDAHLRVLRQELPGVRGAAAGNPADTAIAKGPPPAQLPADVSAFTGRVAELRRLDALLPEPGTVPTMTIAAIAGTAGVGKTALAVHWARRVRDRFPDGQLYVNLRGYAAGAPLRPIEVLARFLRALGVPAERVPTELEEAADLYRSVLAERRLLVVLDNARDVHQVRPLLPGSPGCLVLVTSRDRLGGLVALDGAHRITLDVLTADEANALLARIIGEVVSRDAAAVTELASLCGRLPLALRIAAANLVGQLQPRVAAYTDRLRTGNRLADLQVDGDEQAAVRAAFDASYDALPEPARRLFRLLGLIPGPDFTAEAAAAVTDAAPAAAGALLDRLAAAHLIESNGPGRYALHDLMRLYAAEQATGQETAAERDAALARLYEHYLYTADAAAQVLYPQMLRLELPQPPRPPRPPESPESPESPAGAPPSFPDHTAASAWLDTERPNLLAAINHAAAHGPRQAAWLLADTLRGYFYLRLDSVSWLAAADASLSSAEADGDERAQAAGHLSLATLFWFRTRLPDAIASYQKALVLARRAGWLDGEGGIHGNLGAVYRLSGQPARAAEHLAESLAINRKMGGLARQAATLANLCTLHYELGRLEEAAADGAQAVALFREVASPMGEALSRGARGESLHGLGRLDEAIDHLTRAVELHREVGQRGAEAAALALLAGAHRDAGRLAQALDIAQSAFAIIRDMDEKSNLVPALNALGSVHHLRGEPALAIRYHQEAVETARAVGNGNQEAESLVGLATVHAGAGRYDEAATLGRTALEIARGRGYRMIEGLAVTCLAECELGAGGAAAAIRHAEEALEIHRETGHRLGAARTLTLLGRAHSVAGHAAAGSAGDAAGDAAGGTAGGTAGDVDRARAAWTAALELFGDIGAPEAATVRGLLGG